MGRILLISAIALVACACTPGGRDRRSGLIPPADTPASPGEPAGAPPSSLEEEFSTALDLNGSEPFWTLKIRRDSLVLARPGRLDVVAVNPGARIQGNGAVWEAVAARDGGALKVTLKPGRCSNGMSDREYPYQATVQFGGESLMGCATPE